MDQIPGIIIKTKSVNLTIPANSIYTTTVKPKNFINCFVEHEELGSKLTPIGTFDADNVSSGGNFMIDGNYNSYVYNNTSPGNSNKALPALDLGSSIYVSKIRIKFYNADSYTWSNYKVQGSNDGVTWTDIITGLDSIGKAGQFEILPIKATYRYIRLYCVQSLNTTWCLFSELESYAQGNIYTRNLKKDTEIEVVENTFIQIKNNTRFNQNIKLYYHG